MQQFWKSGLIREYTLVRKIFSFYFSVEIYFSYTELKEWDLTSKCSQEAAAEIFLKEKALSSSLTRFFKSHEWVVKCFKTTSLRTRSSSVISQQASQHLSISIRISSSIIRIENQVPYTQNYTGSWVAGVKEGFGVMFWKDGDRWFFLKN